MLVSDLLKGVSLEDPSPEELLTGWIEQIDNQCSDLAVVNCRGCISDSASPAPDAR
ncbi:MAG: hypothetical protein QOJ99_4080 [Bryobacterales bacterium]|jgi:hypothetical protein|nr:hypothetical protein [Bryobacterales bacterium]